MVSRVLFVLGVICAGAVGFFSPVWYLGFAPLATGLIFAAYDLAPEEAAGDPPTKTPRR